MGTEGNRKNEERQAMTSTEWIDFDRYQDVAHTTAIYPPGAGVYYTALGLAGEAGELCNKVKKLLRDIAGEVTPEVREKLRGELGDVLWYCAEFATAIGDTRLSAVVAANVAKLSDRASRGAIGGSGDTR